MPTATASTAALSFSDVESFDPRAASGGSERISRCPICQSSERAFHFNMETGAFNCKRASCGATGKLSDFWQERPNANRRDRARNVLSAAFAIQPANHARRQQSADATRAPASIAIPGDAGQPATAATWQAHWNGARPLGSTPTSAATPQTGTPAALYLARRGIPETIATAADVRALSLNGREFAAFPFHDAGGAAVAFQARAIDGAPRGHRAQGSKRDGIFATARDALSADRVIVCEAPIDALSLAACGFAAIALGGCNAPAWLPPALAFKRVLLAFDNDANGAGDHAAALLLPALRSFGARPLRLAPHRAKDADKSDWNGMLIEHGARPLRAWLPAHLAHLEYFAE
jgi:hypothetical protein